MSQIGLALRLRNYIATSINKTVARLRLLVRRGRLFHLNWLVLILSRVILMVFIHSRLSGLMSRTRIVNGSPLSLIISGDFKFIVVNFLSS